MNPPSPPQPEAERPTSPEWKTDAAPPPVDPARPGEGPREVVVQSRPMRSGFVFVGTFVAFIFSVFLLEEYGTKYGFPLQVARRYSQMFAFVRDLPLVVELKMTLFFGVWIAAMTGFAQMTRRVRFKYLIPLALVSICGVLQTIAWGRFAYDWLRVVVK